MTAAAFAVGEHVALLPGWTRATLSGLREIVADAETGRRAVVAEVLRGGEYVVTMTDTGRGVWVNGARLERVSASR